jgi:zinc protease
MLDRKSPPPFKQSTAFELLTPERYTLRHGADVLLIRGGEQDVVKLELVFKAGRWFESQRGTSYFAGTQLTKGTPRYTSYQINNHFDFYGVHIEVVPGFDFISVNLYGLTSNITSVLDLFLEIITQAHYPDQELQQVQSIYLQNLKINQEKTSYLASCAFRSHLFGTAHPYGYELEASDVTALARETLCGFRQKHFQDFICILSGKLSDEQATEILAKLDHLPVSRHKAIIHAVPSHAGTVTHVDKPDAVQTSIRVGKQTIGRNHPDYPGFLLLNHLLGGYFGSRLMKNIREEKGLTYGIHSSIQALRQGTYFLIGADVNRENRALTIDEIKRELQLLRTQPVPREELLTARNHFIGSLQTEMNTPFSHADKLKVLNLFDLEQDYFQRLINRMLELDAGSLLQLANQYLTEDELVIISAG